MTYAISADGLALIQAFEGFRAEPVQTPDGNYVVGFAHVRVGGPGAPVSREDAEQLLALDLAPVERVLNEQVTSALTQSQYDALVSFAFSIGTDAFVQSQVFRRVNSGEFVAAACSMDAWRKGDVDGELEVVDALVRRRAAEKAHFLKELPQDTAPPAFGRAKLDHAASILGTPVKHSGTRTIGATVIAVAQPQVISAPQAAALSVAERLTEILRSEPATEALLLTQPAADFEESEDEIVTAHAKPVARKIDPFVPPLPRDRRISKLRDQSAPIGTRFTKFSFKSGEAFETIGLVALLLVGLGLTYLAGSLMFARNADIVNYAGAAALALPGLAATLLSAYAMLRPRHQPTQLRRPYAEAL